MTPLGAPAPRPEPSGRVGLRRVALVAVSLLAALAGVLAAAGGPGHPPPATTPTATLPSTPVILGTRTAAAPGTAGLRAPVDAAHLGQARHVAAGFLAGYLPYLYGHARPERLRAITGGLRSELARHPARITPSQRRRHPRLLALAAVGRAPGAVLATATIADGGPAAYPVRLLLARRHTGWVVTRILP